MFLRNGFSLTFLLVSAFVLLTIMAPATKAECDCNKPESEQATTLDKILHKTICGVKGAAKTVSDKVKDGYHYVKNKLSSSSDANQTEENVTYDVDLRFGSTDEPIQLAN